MTPLTSHNGKTIKQGHNSRFKVSFTVEMNIYFLHLFQKVKLVVFQIWRTAKQLICLIFVIFDFC